MTNDTVDVAVRMGLCKYHKACALMLLLTYQPYEEGYSVKEQAYYVTMLGISEDEVLKLFISLANAGLVDLRGRDIFDIFDKINPIRIKEYHDTINLEVLGKE